MCACMSAFNDMTGMNGIVENNEGVRTSLIKINLK